MKMNNMILIALVALLTVAGGANATTIDSFSEENVVVVDFGHSNSKHDRTNKRCLG